MKYLGCIVLILGGLQAGTVTVDIRGGADFAGIQQAIDSVRDGDTVVVAPGEYLIERPINFAGKRIVVKSEQGPAVTVIRSGAPENSNGGMVVVFESGESEECALDGFTVTGARRPIYRSEAYGNLEVGGILCIGVCSVTIVNCWIMGNVSNDKGGGIYCVGFASPKIRNCTIVGNAAFERGGGVYCGPYSSPSLDHCTIGGNWSCWGGGGLACYESQMCLTSSIIEGNIEGSLWAGEAQMAISFSCVEAADLYPGEGNINGQPLFRGWGDGERVYVDASAGPVGDGSAERPWKTLAPALEYGFALAKGSPCIGTGQGGQNMGADWGTCEKPGQPRRTITLLPGTYSIGGHSLALGVSIIGSGQEETVLEGTVVGLRTGAGLSDLTVTAGLLGGIDIVGGEAPEIRRCAIRGNRGKTGGGLFCKGSGRPVIDHCTIVENMAIYDGGGVACIEGSEPLLRNCTIVRNIAMDTAGGICSKDSRPAIVNCILWQNMKGSIILKDAGDVDVRYSCIESDVVWPGTANINKDPLFCGRPGVTDIFVDGSAAGPGDGTERAPYTEIASAVASSVELCDSSPCLKSGEGNVDMGSNRARCASVNAGQLVIHLAPGSYEASLLHLPAGASIIGSGQDITIIKGSLIGMTTGAVLSDVTVTDGKMGGIMLGGQSPTIRNCTIRDNSSDEGAGGIYCIDGSSPLIENCRIAGNVGYDGGGVGCLRNSSPTLTRCLVEENRSWTHGGGLYCLDRSSPTVSGCTISNNSAEMYGGGMYLYIASDATVVDSSFVRNTTIGWGGGVAVLGASPTFTNCTIRSNSAKIDSSQTQAEGGGFFCRGGDTRPLLTDCVISGNRADMGGGVMSDLSALLRMRGCRISENAADTMRGGGVVCRRAAVDASDCTFLNNWSKESGGGLWASDGSVLLNGCNVEGNNARKTGGGAYLQEGRGQFIDCQILGNAASNEGGALYLACASPAMTNCVIAGNWSWKTCGGIYCSDYHWSGFMGSGSSPNMVNCTIVANSSKGQYGSCCDPNLSRPSFVNCVVWQCEEAMICGGFEYSLYDADPLFMNPGTFDHFAERAMLVGGLPLSMPSVVIQAPDFRLGRGSLAIDAGSSEGAPDHDIAGNARPCGAEVDIGAYESCQAMFVRGDANADGRCNVADAIYMLQYVFASGPNPECRDAADANDDEKIQIADAITVLGVFFGNLGVLPEPYPECGADAVGGDDSLSCSIYPPCDRK